MSIAWSDVEAIAPELSTLAAASQTYILGLVNERMIDDDVWLEFADDGRAYLAAHLGTLATGSGSGSGAVTSESIGPFSRSYASPSDDDALDTTKYGRFYKTLLRMAVAVPALVP